MLHVSLDSFIVETATDKPFSCKERVFWILNSLTSGKFTNESIAIICKRDD